MKLPSSEVMDSLKKALITDPIIAAGLPAVPSDMEAPDELGTPSLVKEANNHTQTQSKKMVKKKITFTVDETDAGRMRAAFMEDAIHGSGLTSFSAWIAAHLLNIVTEKENTYNNGQPFTPVNADVIPKGRR